MSQIIDKIYELRVKVDEQGGDPNTVLLAGNLVQLFEEELSQSISFTETPFVNKGFKMIKIYGMTVEFDSTLPPDVIVVTRK
jgi:hypothetical protein